MDEEKKEHVGLLEEAPGVLSSRRVFGAITISTGGLILVAISIFGFWKVVPGASDSLLAAQTLLITGGSMLGVSFFSFLGGKK